MLVDSDAGVLSCACKCNAARLDRQSPQPAKTSMTKGNRRGRTRPQGGCTHRYPNCYAKVAAESARWRRSLRYQTVGREPARPWCLFLLRMHIEHSSTTPLASNYGAPVFHELTVPGAVLTPSARKLFLHMRALRGASMRSMRYIESVFSMPLRERCRSTYHRLTEHGGVPDRRTAWDLM